MSNLFAFINPAYREKRVSFELGDRFVNEDGTMAKFVMRALTQEEVQLINKRATHDVDAGGAKLPRLDENEFLNRCIIASMEVPDLTNREICLSCKTEDPVCVPARFFFADEYKKVASTLAVLCGLDEYSDLATFGEVTKN